MVRPTSNKRLTYREPGSDLDLVEQDIQSLATTEVLVKVHAASINPVDTQLWRSQLAGMVKVPGGKGMGRDFSGTVVEVGSDVKGWTEGDDIFGLYFQAVGSHGTRGLDSTDENTAGKRDFQSVHNPESKFGANCQEAGLSLP